jgi:hypothetical protein
LLDSASWRLDTGPLNERDYHSLAHALNLDPPRVSLKIIIIIIQACPQDPQKSEKNTPMSPKDTKMIPKITPPDTSLHNKWKK